MSTPKLDSEIKTRLPGTQKRALQEIAEGRHLDTADIVREALREYIDRNPPARRNLPKAVAA